MYIPPSPDVRVESLDEIFRGLGIQLPVVNVLSPEHLPRVPQDLLASGGGLTRRLEATYSGCVQLNVLKSVVQGDTCYRHVLLVLNHGTQVAAMAFIRISLRSFGLSLRQKVLAEMLPLGKLLDVYEVQHRHVSQMYFSVQADPSTSDYLVPDENSKLYGRRVLIFNDSDEVLADSVEVLSSGRDSLST